MKTSIALLLAMLQISLAIPARADDKPQTPAPPGFDYWQPDWMVRELWGPGRMPTCMMARLLRHTTYVNFGVPSEYEGAQSTANKNVEAVAKGAAVYTERCASCHGPNGTGHGDAAQALTPSPALLAFMIRRPVSVDEYLLWTISDGGQQFRTAMPAFRDSLSRDDIWAVIAYMRAGFPKVGATLEDKK